MKKYPKIVQIDGRGQIVIPKDIRSELGIDEGSGFYVYSIEKEGILLKKIDTPELSEHRRIVDEIEEKSDRIDVDKKNLKKSIENYKRTKKGNLDVI
ncbi:AbrB/MazE/SpoVT family DNA-binding domain-containing protein [Candidatus Woesearchaeota archaeon]|nr:AbrB/MazE/SpoVT family DNA-binding domain-containing protein [Candidatus Woesearchaeota archaeon]